ncbi:type II toxin-antitoxin system Phd/YefM family antitoxin [Deltaproteobacteria bacterium PRO3]|nr:type II toxin-antitoxin system Phd/YefM family antitoxin [Deltaproteobacteria bacterium PRO3]
MAISFEKSILPMSELRTNLDKVKAQLKKTPIIITNNGRPDFGVCDLETLEIASQIKDLRDLLKRRARRPEASVDASAAFRALDRKYHGR